MKILYTGMSARECGDTKRETLRFDMNAPVLEAAAAVGTVDRRRVHVGEDLSDYDLIILCHNLVLSFNTRHGVLGSLWAASQTKVPILINCTDWQHRAWQSHLRTLLSHPWYLNKTIGDERLYMTEDDVTCDTYQQELMLGGSRLNDPWPQNWSAVIPTFSWGDHDSFTENLPVAPGQYACCDYSPFGLASVEDPPDAPDIEHGWLLPSLSPQDKWVEKQKLTWPVKYLGSRKLKAERVSEQEVLNRVSLYTGTLSPRYNYLMGSGWWRIRYNYTALACSIIAGDPAEAGCLGKAFSYTPRQIEDMELVQAIDVGAEQKVLMESRYWSLAQSQEYLQSVITWAASK